MARLSLPELLCEIRVAVAAADFPSGGWKKRSVRGQGSEEKEEEAKGDERKEKAVQHPQTGIHDRSSLSDYWLMDG